MASSTAWPNRPPITNKRVLDRAGDARLALTASGAAALRPRLEMVHAMMDALSAVPLGETPPASGFSPRWTE